MPPGQQPPKRTLTTTSSPGIEPPSSGGSDMTRDTKMPPGQQPPSSLGSVITSSPGPGQPMRGGPGTDRGPKVNPEEAIMKLPAALQPSFKQILEVKKGLKRSRIEGGLKLQRSILQSLEDTKKFLADASDEDRKTVTEVLKMLDNTPDQENQPMPGDGTKGTNTGGKEFLDRNTPDHENQPMPGDGTKGTNTGGKEFLDRRIQDIEMRIAELDRELSQSGR